MLIGEYSPVIDPKGRISFPAKLREELGATFIVTKGLDNCLSVYRLEEWTVLVERLKQLPSKARTIQRFILGGAVELSPDKQGRILIPQNLRDWAGLNGSIVVVGVSDRAEIWDAHRWAEANETLTADMVAEAMDELGF
ncbi:MAG: division/cell wall cluster transcriptional repressor MraZ [Oscillospiraceae bacterium]